jgi:hypothetical protein
MVDPQDHMIIGVPELSFGTEDGEVMLGFNDATVDGLYIIINERQLQTSGLPNIIMITQLPTVNQPYGIRWSRRLQNRHLYGIYGIPVTGFRSAILEFNHSAQSSDNPELVTVCSPVSRYSSMPRLFLRVGVL